jgi:5-formyltetrahydrofolate cyclo-ligase
MEEIRATKDQIRKDIMETIDGLPPAKKEEKSKTIVRRLFGFANFLESKVALLYINHSGEVPTSSILQKTLEYNKVVVLPAFDTERHRMTLMKVDDLKRDLASGPRGVLEPDARRCKSVPIERIDIAIIPGIAFDEKGGRIGTGRGFYDRLIPNLDITTRKVALALEEQIVPQVPIESHDKLVDIIITDQRIIYKI